MCNCLQLHRECHFDFDCTSNCFVVIRSAVNQSYHPGPDHYITFLQHSHYTLLWKASVLLKSFLLVGEWVWVVCTHCSVLTKYTCGQNDPSRKLFAFKLMETFLKKFLSLLSFKTRSEYLQYVIWVSNHVMILFAFSIMLSIFKCRSIFKDVEIRYGVHL